MTFVSSLLPPHWFHPWHCSHTTHFIPHTCWPPQYQQPKWCVVWVNGNFVYYIIFYLFSLQMLPPHHCTNDGAAHLPFAPYVTQVDLHHSNGSNYMSRCIIWAQGNLFNLIYFIFSTDTAMSPLHQQCHCPPPACSLCH